MYEISLIDLMREIVESYEEDDDIDNVTLEDLQETLEVKLYERRTTISSLADAFDDSDS